MSMIDFLLLDINTAYGIAAAIVLMLAMLELIGLLIGVVPSELFEQALSSIAEGLDPPESISGLLGWFFLNKLPFIIWLIIFLTVFSITGYTTNFISLTGIGQSLPTIANHAIALIASVFSIRTAGSRLSGLLSRNESLAVSNSSFSGKIASITLGTATLNNPAEAVLTDEYRKKHYIMVMPCSEKESFKRGDDVVLIERQQGFWTAIKFNNT